jgi:hypothetical protein
MKHFSETAKDVLQLGRMNRDGNVLAHELTLTLEDEPISLRGDRQRSTSTDQKLVSLAESRCFNGLVDEGDLACKSPC